MRVVLSFDDGRKDNYDVVHPVLSRYGLFATFNIATAYVDGSILQEDSPCPNESMSIENVKELHRYGHEIACHGDCHRNDMDDIRAGYQKLKEWLDRDISDKLGFASPQSLLALDEIQSRIEEYKKLFSYIRISSYDRDLLFIRILRKSAHVLRSNLLYRTAFRKNLGGIKDGFVAVSVPVMHGATLEQVKSLVRLAIKENEDCILMFHSVLPKGEKYYMSVWSWDMENFDKLCCWLKKEMDDGKLHLVRTIDLL